MSDDPFDMERTRLDARRNALRKRKARALMASTYEPYAKLGRDLMQEIESEQETRAKESQRAFDDWLKVYGVQREQQRDEAEAARHDELMAFNREREQHDVEAEQRRFEQSAAQAAAQLGLQRQTLAQQRAFREAQLAAQERIAAMENGLQPGGAPESDAVPTHGDMFASHAPAGAPPPGGADHATTPGGSVIPSTRVPGKTTEGQRNKLMDVAGSIARLNDTYRAFKSAPDSYGGWNTAVGVAGSLPVVGSQAQSLAGRWQSPQARQVRNAVEDVVSSILRQEAGASLTEFESLKRQFLPQTYDSSEQVDEKLRNLLNRQITAYKALGGVDDVGVPDSGKPDVDALVRKYLSRPKAGG